MIRTTYRGKGWRYGVWGLWVVLLLTFGAGKLPAQITVDEKLLQGSWELRFSGDSLLLQRLEVIDMPFAFIVFFGEDGQLIRYLKDDYCGVGSEEHYGEGRWEWDSEDQTLKTSIAITRQRTQSLFEVVPISRDLLFLR